MTTRSDSPLWRLGCPLRRILALPVLLGLLSLGAQAQTPAQSQGQPDAEFYTLGVVPYQVPSQLELVYAPVAAELGAALGRPVRFRTAAASAEFLPRLRRGGFDISLVQPFYYLAAFEEAGYLPLVRLEDPSRAVLVTRATSPLRSLEDLRGRTVATPPRYATNTVILLQALRAGGLVPGRDFVIKTTNSQQACLHQVLIGEADACTSGASQIVPRPGGPDSATWRTLLTDDSLPNMVFVAHSRMPAAERQRLQQALLALNASPAGRAMLDSLGSRKLVPALDSDYEPVRRFVRKLEEPWLPPDR